MVMITTMIDNGEAITSIPEILVFVTWYHFLAINKFPDCRAFNAAHFFD